MRCSVSTDSHYQTTNYGKKSKNFITWDTKNEETSRRDHGIKAQAFFCLKRFSTCVLECCRRHQQKHWYRSLSLLGFPLKRLGELEKCTKTQIDETLSKNTKTPTVKKERVSKHAGKTKVKERSHRERRPPVKLREPAEQMEGKQVFTVGQTVEVLWNEKDLEGTNWEPGWYKGEIERFDEENDIVFIWYYKDHAVYSLDATSALLDEVIRPA